MNRDSYCPDPQDPQFWPEQSDCEVRLAAADIMCRAAEIDSTHSGTPSVSQSDWRLGRSPGSYR